MTNFLLKRSSVANKRPDTTQIDFGELALNIAAVAPGLFLKNSNGTTISKLGPVQVSTNSPNGNPVGSSGTTAGEFWLQTGSAPKLNANAGAWSTLPDLNQTLPFDSLVNATGTRVTPRHAWGINNLYTDPVVGQLPFTFMTSNATTNPGCNFAGGGGGSAAACNLTTYNLNAVEDYCHCYQLIDQVTRQRTLISALNAGAIFGVGGATVNVVGSGSWWRVGSLFAPCCYTDNISRGWIDAVGGGTTGTNFWITCQFGLNGATENNRRFMTFTQTDGAWGNASVAIDVNRGSGNITYYRGISGVTSVRTTAALAFNTGDNNKNTFAVYDDGTVLRYSFNGGAWTAFLESGVSSNSNYTDSRMFLGRRNSGDAIAANNFGNSNPISACVYYVGNATGMPTQASLLAAANSLHASV
jgi:hypothetical protein